MRSILKRSRVGKDGVIRLDVPSEFAGIEVDITIVPSPTTMAQSEGVGDVGWSPGFFEDIVGGWEGDPLTRGPQGEYETRRTA